MLSHLSLLYLLRLAGSRAHRIMSKENKCYFISTRFRRCFPTHTMYIFQRISFHFCFGLTGAKRDFGPLFFCRFSESGAAGLQRYCVGARRRRGTPTGPTLLLKTVLERGTVFFYVCFSRGLTASSCRTTQVSGVLKPALHWEKRLGEHGKRGCVDMQFSSRMEVFHAANTEMQTQLDDRRLRLFSAIHASQYTRGQMRSVTKFLLMGVWVGSL